jgi:Ser/Thr protein kinase RdoA (MazF antagonist)
MPRAHPLQHELPYMLNKYHLGDIAQITPIHSQLSFSGAQIWKVQAFGENLCLRAWPENTSKERILAIQSVIKYASARIHTPLAVALPTKTGELLIEHENRNWELTAWLCGEALPQAMASAEQVVAACQVLATWHAAVQDYPGNNMFPLSGEGMSAGVRNRTELLEQWQAEKLQQIKTAGKNSRWQSQIAFICDFFPQFHAVYANSLHVWSQQRLPLQICLRDVWRPHLLFTGNAVTGLIDYDAMQLECVSGDIVRLLGSLVADDTLLWERGMEAYNAIRPLSSQERELVPLLDATATVLSYLQWLSWLIIERREFANLQGVDARICEIQTRLEHLRQKLSRQLWIP